MLILLSFFKIQLQPDIEFSEGYAIILGDGV